MSKQTFTQPMIEAVQILADYGGTRTFQYSYSTWQMNDVRESTIVALEKRGAVVIEGEKYRRTRNIHKITLTKAGWLLCKDRFKQQSLLLWNARRRLRKLYAVLSVSAANDFALDDPREVIRERFNVPTNWGVEFRPHFKDRGTVQVTLRCKNLKVEYSFAEGYIVKLNSAFANTGWLQDLGVTLDDAALMVEALASAIRMAGELNDARDAEGWVEL